jgi:hypothetical protein
LDSGAGGGVGVKMEIKLPKPPVPYEPIYWVLLHQDALSYKELFYGSWESINEYVNQNHSDLCWELTGKSLVSTNETGYFDINPTEPPDILARLLMVKGRDKEKLKERICKSLGVSARISNLNLSELLKLDPFRRALRIASLNEDGL